MRACVCISFIGAPTRVTEAVRVGSDFCVYMKKENLVHRLSKGGVVVSNHRNDDDDDDNLVIVCCCFPSGIILYAYRTMTMFALRCVSPSL